MEPLAESTPPTDESTLEPSESSSVASEPGDTEQEPDEEPTSTDVCLPPSTVGAGGVVSPLPPEVTVDELGPIATAASLELLAVGTYAAIRDAGAAGRLGDVPPALTEYVAIAIEHHQVALETWDRVLVAAQRPAASSVPADVARDLDEQLSAASDAIAAATVALLLEEILAATYLAAIGTLVSEPAVRLAGSILPIDRQHISVLLLLIGEYPVPETFATAELAYAQTGS